MGIKHFFSWFRKKFSLHIYEMKHNQKANVSIDHLMIDMNGIFHNSAQKIFEYGNYKSFQRFLTKPVKKNFINQQKECFEEICRQIKLWIDITEPKKSVILCVDGPAPISKQCQQRQRRFMSNTECSFDSNCITPGTRFMDFLSKYIDWFIRKEMTENEKWQNLKIVFSNEKVPGEGEHKIINYIRAFRDENDSYCIHGMDADLIMLALGTHLPNIYILREEMMTHNVSHYLINIGEISKELSNMLSWNTDTFKKKQAINDFIFICFMVGNDFLPHIPGLEIIEGGIEHMINMYHTICVEHGHITDSNAKFRKKALYFFLKELGKYEQHILENKYKRRVNYFPDETLESCVHDNTLDIKEYRQKYYENNLANVDQKELCHKYLEGMQWVMTYYIYGVSDWKWRFPYHYAPFSYTLKKHVPDFTFPSNVLYGYSQSQPISPFLQLLAVLPLKSYKLLPEPFSKLKEEVEEFCPKEFKIDLAGKRKEYEAVVLLPIVDYERLEYIYYRHIKNVDSIELKRNIFGKSFVYNYDSSFSQNFYSYYGQIKSSVKSNVISF